MVCFTDFCVHFHDCGFCFTKKANKACSYAGEIAATYEKLVLSFSWMQKVTEAKCSITII